MLGPALAMLRIPGPVCFSWKFSSWNLAPAKIRSLLGASVSVLGFVFASKAQVLGRWQHCNSHREEFVRSSTGRDVHTVDAFSASTVSSGEVSTWA